VFININGACAGVDTVAAGCCTGVAATGADVVVCGICAIAGAPVAICVSCGLTGVDTGVGVAVVVVVGATGAAIGVTVDCATGALATVVVVVEPNVLGAATMLDFATCGRGFRPLNAFNKAKNRGFIATAILSPYPPKPVCGYLRALFCASVGFNLSIVLP
jgi:hypothetical protein